MRSRSKYHAQAMNIDGITFASKAEAFHYQDLRLLEAAGIISELELQPEFIILKKFRDKFTGKTIPARKYVGDFRYRDEHGQIIVEDVKGFETDVFRLKWDIIRSLYPRIKFVVVKKIAHETKP